MSKVLFFLVLLSSNAFCQSQKIIGLKPEVVSNIIRLNHNNTSTYNLKCNVVHHTYRNGAIQEISECCDEWPPYGLNVPLNFCTYYQTTNGLISNVTTIYQDINKQRLINILNADSSLIRAKNRYYTSDFEYNFTVTYSYENELISIFKRTNVNYLSPEEKQDFQSLKDSIENARKDEYNRKLEIVSTIHDYSKFGLQKDLEEEQYLKLTTAFDSSPYNPIPRFSTISLDKNYKDSLTASFSIEYIKYRTDYVKTPDGFLTRFAPNGKFGYQLIYNNGSQEFSNDFIKSILVELDFQKIENLKVSTKAKLEIDILILRGVVIIKKKSNEQKFMGEVPSQVVVDKIKRYLNDQPNGKHMIGYEYRKIMGKESVNLKTN